MKNLKFLFLVTLCLVLCLGMANANIDIDETFDDGSAFTDLGWAYGNDNPTSAGVKGISVYRNAAASFPATATLAYNMTAGNLQGSLVNVGTGPGKAWRLGTDQKIFWGLSGQVGVPSGGGVIANDGGNNTIAQLGIACDPIVLNSSTGTLVGSVSYLFGAPTTYTLTYELRVNNAKTGLTVTQLTGVQANASTVFQTLGDIPADKFSMLTTVWNGKKTDADPNQHWGTIAKTGYGMTMYPSTIVGFPRGYGWQVNKSPGFAATATAFTTYEGSADGRLYPVGKGWRNGQRLTSSTLGTAVYSFLDKKPAGTTTTTVPLADNPWIIPGKFDVEANKLLTWKIAAANTTSATLVIDDIYFENTIRNYGNTAAEFKAADYRLHEFDQTKRYKPNATTLDPNPQYLLAGLPVELSIFEVR